MPPADPPLTDRARAEEVAEVFRFVVVGVLGAAVSAIGTSAVFVRLGITSVTRATLFAAFICVCALLHILLRAAFLRARTRMQHWRRWGAFATLAFIEGLGWGWSPVGLVTNGDYAAELVAMFVTLSVATGAIIAFGAYRPAFLALFIPATVPVTIADAFFARNPLQQATFFLLVIYVIAMGLVGAFASASFQRLVQLRLRAETLADELRDQIEIAEAANRAKSSFLAAASHDLRQPVHALGLFVGALRGMAIPEDAMMILERIEVSTQSLDSLFSALLDISRLDAGVVEVSPRVFLLGPMLERICRDHCREAQDKGIELVRAHTSIACRSDPILLERILRNLVSNAVRYTRAGRVLVGARRRGDAVSIEVWDTGPGIPESQREEIFKEYFQIGNAERDRTKGLGLGLAIVRRLTRLLGCPLHLRSQPGRGSCFSIEVPRARVPVAVVPDEEMPELTAPPMPRRLIVVVDDEIEIRAAMSTLLERWGHQVIVAEDGAGAMARLVDIPTRPDLIISDFRLRREETGLQVIEALRNEYNAALPAILITGDTAPERLVEARDSGLLILHKPVSNGRLRAAIANSLVMEVV